MVCDHYLPGRVHVDRLLCCFYFLRFTPSSPFPAYEAPVPYSTGEASKSYLWCMYSACLLAVARRFCWLSQSQISATDGPRIPQLASSNRTVLAKMARWRRYTKRKPKLESGEMNTSSKLKVQNV